jgi:hypothetical protein
MDFLEKKYKFFFLYYLPMISKHILITLTIEKNWYVLHTISFESGRLLTDKLMLQGFLQSRLMSEVCKFYDRYNDLIHNHKLSLSHMLSDIFYTNSYTVLGTLTLTAGNSAFMKTWSWNWAHGECDRSTGDAYSPRHLIPPLVFQGVRVSLIFTVLWIVPVTSSGHWFWLRMSSFYLIWRTDFDCRLSWHWFD